MQRVMIIGQPGSGKSTLAARLGEITGLPVFYIDREVHWKPGWIERTPLEKAILCAEIHAKDEWIFEGGHSSTWPDRLDRADTLVWIDLPLSLRLWRVVRRTIVHHGRSRPEMPENCPERFNREFFEWIWVTRKTGRQIAQKLASLAPSDKNLAHLRSRKEVAFWLAEVEQQHEP